MTPPNNRPRPLILVATGWMRITAVRSMSLARRAK
jgi:hypothetical protein